MKDKKNNLTLVGNPPIVRLENLTKEFETVRALDDVTLDIPEGKIIGLLGPNGSGKTTLLKILAGLYRAYEGTVLIDGRHPGAKSKSLVAFMADRPAFSLKKSAKELLWIYEEFFDDFSREKFDNLMGKFSIPQDKPFNEMSKGMIDKVQISFALARDARLFLLDEPFGGVDVAARESVIDTVIENFDTKGTIIIATHLISEIERLFDSVVVLKEGKVLLNEDCDEIRSRYGCNLNDAMKEIF